MRWIELVLDGGRGRGGEWFNRDEANVLEFYCLRDLAYSNRSSCIGSDLINANSSFFCVTVYYIICKLYLWQIPGGYNSCEGS